MTKYAFALRVRFLPVVVIPLSRLALVTTALFVCAALTPEGAIAQERVHNPANDARGCVSLVVDKNSSGNSLQMQNNCGYSVSVLWPGGLVNLESGKSYPSFRHSTFTFFACRYGGPGGAELYQTSEMAARNEVICNDAPTDAVNSLRRAYVAARAAYDKAKAVYDRISSLREPPNVDLSGAYAKRNNANSEELNLAMNEAKQAILGTERELINRSKIVTTIQDNAFDNLKSQVQQLSGDMAALEAANQSLRAETPPLGAEPIAVAFPRLGSSSGSAMFREALSQAEQDERDRPAREARERAASGQAAAAAAATAAAEARQTPEERITKSFDQRIVTARNQCAEAEGSCQKGCLAVAAVGVLALFSRNSTVANAASEETQKCSNRCTEAKSGCDDQVAALEQEKSRALAGATGGTRTTPGAMANVRDNANTGYSSASTDTGTSSLGALPGNGEFEILLVDRHANTTDLQTKIRVSVATFEANAARLKNGNYVLQYPVGALQNPFKLEPATSRGRPASPQCKYTPSSYSLPNVSQKPPEETCHRLLMDAIHESASERIEMMRGGAKIFAGVNVSAVPGTSTGRCKDDLKALDAEAGATRKRRPANASSESFAQVGQYFAINKIRILESGCKGQPEYDSLLETHRVLGDLQRTCAMFKTDKSVCAPRLAY